MLAENQPGDVFVYQITVQGKLGQNWSGYFNGKLLIKDSFAGDGSACTTLTGTVADQAALRGLMNKIWDLGLVVVSVIRIFAQHGEPS